MSMLSPLNAFSRDYQAMIDALNQGGSELYGDIVKATPSGVGGRLRRSWVLSPATTENPELLIGSNSQYLLSLEMGRKPGSGISREGQEAVALWARRKLRLNESEVAGFAYLLSQRYKELGRPAVGFLGLARQGDAAKPVPREPIPGGLLAEGIRKTSRLIDSV